MSEEAFVVRRATIDDIAIITKHRRAMFQDMGSGTRESLDAMDLKFTPWIARKLASGNYLGWFIINPQNDVVASAGLWLIDWPPGPLDQSEHRGYIYNVYTQPDYRQRGLARKLVKIVIKHCRENKIKIVALHASEQGRKLYESLGFKQTNEMRLTLVEKDHG